MTFFPPLFKEANTQRRAQMIEAPVEDWPYPCLPVGLLMNNPHLETYQAVLHGIDIWLEWRFHLRRQKLRVINLRNRHHDFWDVWTGREGGDYSAETLPEQQVVKSLSRCTLRWHLKVVTELQLPQDEYQTQLLHWAKKRRGSLQLCCVSWRLGHYQYTESGKS